MFAITQLLHKLVSCFIISMVDCCVASVELINHSIDRSNSIVFNWYSHTTFSVVYSKKSQMGIFTTFTITFFFLLLDIAKNICCVDVNTKHHTRGFFATFATGNMHAYLCNICTFKFNLA
jgi:hypothetical protein